MAAVVAALLPLPTQSITITKPTRPDTDAYTQSHAYEQTTFTHAQICWQSRGTQIYRVIQAGSQLGCHSAIIPQTKNASTSMLVGNDLPSRSQAQNKDVHTVGWDVEGGGRDSREAPGPRRRLTNHICHLSSTKCNMKIGMSENVNVPESFARECEQRGRTAMGIWLNGWLPGWCWWFRGLVAAMLWNFLSS